VLSFNDQGVLQKVQTLDQDDSLPVDVVSGATPSPGSETSFMQQLFGNVGRFSPGGQSGLGGPTGGAPGGGAPGEAP